jgi:L-gulonolactone oxidase
MPAVNRGAQRLLFGERKRVDRSDRIFNVRIPPTHREMGCGIPREMAPLALRRLRDLIARLRIEVGFVVDLRFVAAGELLMSSCYQRDTCKLGAHIGEHADRSLYFVDIFQTLRKQLGGRPHWGKEHDLGAAEISVRFPGYGTFAALRRELDPLGVFENAFIRRVFPRQGTTVVLVASPRLDALHVQGQHGRCAGCVCEMRPNTRSPGQRPAEELPAVRRRVAGGDASDGRPD